MAAPYTFYYNAQIRNYISQFLRIFSGFQVQEGVDRDNDGDLDMLSVNVAYGNVDRVMGSLLQNQSESFVSQKIPLISGNLNSVRLDPNRRISRYHQDNVAYPTTRTPAVAERVAGTPVVLSMELNLYASNTDQMFQMLEQILLLFNPALEIQRSSNILDWTYIAKVELTGINNQQNFPIGQQRRILVWSLSFDVEAWVNYPMLQATGLIDSIIANIHDESISVPGVNMDSITITDTTKDGP